jgi:hypothetical protein
MFTVHPAEASSYPGIILIITNWYTPKEIAARVTIFSTSYPGALIFTGFMQASLSANDFGRLKAWQWLFVFNACVIADEAARLRLVSLKLTPRPETSCRLMVRLAPSLSQRLRGVILTTPWHVTADRLHCRLRLLGHPQREAICCSFPMEAHKAEVQAASVL